MNIGLPKETYVEETRVALSPEVIKKLIKKGFQVQVEKSAGEKAGFLDREYEAAGAKIVDQATAFDADIVGKVRRPNSEEVKKLKKGSILLSFLEPYLADSPLAALAETGVSAFAMELIPRTSRAQTMDALSSQANIAGYRAVIEAAGQYGRFFPLMMTSAGSAKPAKVIVLGAGVAGLQAIATAKRLGAIVEAYDIRAEVKEQIQSLGAKFVELDVGEEGSGQGGYARELSEESKQKQKQQLTERIKKFDIVISTANIPGRKAPVLVTEEAVRGMRPGSIIVDMAASNGGNCPLSEPDKVVKKHDVFIVGFTNYPARVPTDSSHFYAHNLMALINLLVENRDGRLHSLINLEDDIIAASLATHQGQVRLKRS